MRTMASHRRCRLINILTSHMINVDNITNGAPPELMAAERTKCENKVGYGRMRGILLSLLTTDARSRLG